MFMKKNCDKQNNNHSSVQHLEKRVENQKNKKREQRLQTDERQREV